MLFLKNRGCRDFSGFNVYSFCRSEYPKFYKMDNLSKLGFLAAEILLKGTDHEKKYGGIEIGMVLSQCKCQSGYRSQI